MEPTTLYFGCTRGVWGDTQYGHRFIRPGGKFAYTHEAEAMSPWGIPDGTLAPRQGGSTHLEAPQGNAALHHKDGWTALAFWDRSGDSRGASNSVFLIPVNHMSFDDALAAARENFPELFERFPFGITEVVARP